MFAFFSSLENYFGFRTTNVKAKTDHSVSLRWKVLNIFKEASFFSDCAPASLAQIGELARRLMPSIRTVFHLLYGIDELAMYFIRIRFTSYQ